MKVISMRILVLLFAVLCASCSSTLPSLKPYHLDVQQGNVVTSKMMLQLKPGMAKSQVRYLMGTPLLQDSFHQDRWDYLYQMNKGGDVIERRRVILEFKEDGLVAVRGDVIAAGSPGAENAPMANISDVKTARSDKTLLAEDAKASWIDRFKFWKDDEKAVVPLVTSKPVEVAKIEAPKPQLAKVEAPVPAVVEPVVVPTAIVPTPPASEPSMIAIEQASVNPDVSTELTSADLLKEELASVVVAWAEAWARKDINAYLKFYSDKFQPEGMKRQTWAAQRKQKIVGQAGKISLSLEKMTVNVYPTKSRVGFIQHYSNGKYSDAVVKVLNFERENNYWLIVKEEVVTQLPKLDAKVDLGPKTEAASKQDVPNAPLSNENAKPRDVTIDEKSEAMPAQMVQDSANKTAEPELVTKPDTTKADMVPAPQEVKAEVKEPSPAKVEPAKVETKAAANKAESNKDKPLPPEGAPGYFERMLEKIGF